MGKVDLALALDAISQDLDAQGEALAEQSGQLESLTRLVIATRDTALDTQRMLESFIQDFGRRVVPAIDRLVEVDELRARVAELEQQAAE